MSELFKVGIGIVLVAYVIRSTPKPAKSLKEIDKDVTLWMNYTDTYFEILKHPRATNALWNHPGMRFMRRGWRIITAVLFIIYLTGVFD